MSASLACRIEDLTSIQIQRLTRLLRLPPGCLPTHEWLRSQAASLGNLPPSLLKPTGLFSRLLLTLAPRALLCETHKVLDSNVIHSVFSQLSEELSLHLQRLIESPSLPRNVDALVKRLQELNTSQIFQGLCQIASKASYHDTSSRKVFPNCEACILAAVGGNHQSLLDLRATIMGRKKKRRPPTLLLKLVEGWIEGTGKRESILGKSNALAREVRQYRRKMQLARRERGARKSNEAVREEDGDPLLLEPELEFETEGDDTDEIDKMNELRFTQPISDIYEVQSTSFTGFRTINYTEERDTLAAFDPRAVSKPQHCTRSHITYTDSLYSNDETAWGPNNLGPESYLSPRTSEERAEDYIQLIRRDDEFESSSWQKPQ